MRAAASPSRRPPAGVVEFAGPVVRTASGADEAEDVEEGLPLAGEFRLQAGRAVAVGTGPRLGAVLVAAARAGVGVLHLDQFEVLLPVRPLLGQRRGAEADLDPLDGTIVAQAGV